MMKLTVVVFLVTGFFSVAAQNIQTDTVEWALQGYSVNTDSTGFAMKGKMISYGNARVDWIQYVQTTNGGYRLKTISFVATASAGEWTDIQGDGQLDLTVTGEEWGGVIRFKRAGSRYVVFLELAQTNGPMKRAYFDVLNTRIY